MDHLVYLDKKSLEFEKIKFGNKSMIIRGAAGRKMPYGRVNKNDNLYFIQNDGSGCLVGKAVVSDVINSEKLEKEESVELVERNQQKLNLTSQQTKRWAGKRYLVLITFEGFSPIDYIQVDRSNYSNMDDWIPLESINSILV